MKKIFTSIGTFLCCVIFFNFYFLMTEISNPSELIDDSYQGRKWKPGQYYAYEQETFCMGSINNSGYLGPDYPVEKGANTLRIAILGDSYAAGRQVKDKYHFRSMLENLLREKTNKKVEVLNFGLDGISFRTMYMKYLLVISKYNPDIIVFFVNTPKIFMKDSYQLPQIYSENDSLKINFDFNKTEQFKLRQNLSIIRNTGFISLAEKSYANIREGRFLKILFDKNYSGEKIFVDSVYYRDEPVENVNIVRMILKDLQNVQKNNKLVYLIPNSKIQEDIETMIQSYEIKVLNPFDYIKSIGKDYNELVYWPITDKRGHLNFEGHKIIADFLCNELGRNFDNKK